MRLCLSQSLGLHQTLLIDHGWGCCLLYRSGSKELNKAGAVGLRERGEKTKGGTEHRKGK